MTAQDLALRENLDHADAEPTGTAGRSISDTLYKNRWIVLFLVLAAEVMDLVDATIVNIAAPSIRTELGGSLSTMQWFLAAYTVAFAVALVTCGRLGDIFGRKTMFLTGAIGFTAASLICGLAQSPEMLISSRVLQGLFGAVMIPQGLALIKAAFPPDEIGKAFAAFGPIMGLSAVAGPVIAGVLLDADLWGTGWRMIFFINLPLGVTAVLGAIKYMPDLRPETRTGRLDPLGTVLLTAASAALIFPLVQGHELGWPAWTFAMMAGSVVLFGLFFWNERRSSDPIIEPTLFDNRGFTAGLAVITSFFVAMMGLMLVFNLYTQAGLHYSPLKAGLAFMPWSFGIAVGAAAAGGYFGPKYGRHVLHVGIAVVIVGMGAFWWTINAHGLAATVWDFAPATFVAGLGCGAVFAPLFDIVLADINDREVGSASGVLTAMQQFGGAIGVAVVGTLFFELLPDHAFVDSMKTVVWVAALLFAVSFVAAFLLPKRAREGAGSH
ncbi:MAG TPA: MFS transporter [Nocardioidaceae bacterium]|nr:MFS transporter [Nocardioidaceae bacterium]